MVKFPGLAAIFVILSSCNMSIQDEEKWIIKAPAQSEYTLINPKGITVIPNGRYITPLGKSITIAPHPYGLEISHNGDIAVTANSGINPISISIIRGLNSGNLTVKQVPENVLGDNDVLASVYMGLAITPDDSAVYVSAGQENKIYLFDLFTGERKSEINCFSTKDSVSHKDGFIGDLTLTSDGKTLYAVDQINFELLIIDAVQNKVMNRVKTGRYPFGLALSPDEKKIYVANVGMYEYKIISSVDPENLENTAEEFPVYAYLSEASVKGINTDTLVVPPLGEPNGPESFSVWTISLDGENPKVINKVKTGFLVGELVDGVPAVGGSSPNSIVSTEKYVFVSNGNNDCISVMDINSDTIVKNIFLQPDTRLKNLRGIIPFGISKSPDNKNVFVAEAGLNAIGIIDADELVVKGHIPVGWFPSKVKVSPDGKKLIVANAKGYGSGPNGGNSFKAGPEGSYIGSLMKGTLSVLEIPRDIELDKYTNKVINNNFRFERYTGQDSVSPIPQFPGEFESPIKHIVFISKENRTYDEVFGQIAKGKGESRLARYGKDVSMKKKSGDPSMTGLTIMPNHLKLAAEFSTSDNFYVDADVSADGHRWLVCTYPNQWVEVNSPLSYGGGRSSTTTSEAPGSLAIENASGAIYPEDYNEAGSLWDNLGRHNIDFFNFGFGVMFEPHFTLQHFKFTGYKQLINYPLPGPLFDKTSRKYPTYNMMIPDQFRADMFIEEFSEKWLTGNDSLPSVLTIILPNDHGAGDRPEEGYPYRESYMADNDLALGRIVEFLSSTPYWKNMAIFVTEDDAQDGRDHVDAHRSLLLVISPYTKKNYMSHVHYSFGSIFKTFWNILGIPALNHYDAGSNDLGDMFTNKPDFAPYTALPVDIRIFDPQKALDPLDEKFNWKAVENSPILDNPNDMNKN